MFSEKGQLVALAWSVSDGTYSPATGAVSGATAGSASANAVLLPLARARKVDGTNIVATDETLLLSAIGNTGAAFSPPVGTTVTYADGSKATIVAIDRLAPAGMSIMFDAVVRGHQ